MASLNDDKYQACRLTPDWIARGAAELGLRLGNTQVEYADTQLNEGSIIEFYAAIRTGDLDAAVSLCSSSKRWHAMVLQAIDRLDRDWQDDILMIGDVAEAYWALRRVLSEISSERPPEHRPSLHIGSAAIYLPTNEQHTFGAQLLIDQITRIGWNVDLWIEDLDRNALEPLRANYFDVLGVSVGSDYALDGLADTITSIRQRSLNPDVCIMIGGSALTGSSGQYSFLGADYIATTSDDAIRFFSNGWNTLRRLGGRYDG